MNIGGHSARFLIFKQVKDMKVKKKMKKYSIWKEIKNTTTSDLEMES
jgi:hypothetical protein